MILHNFFLNLKSDSKIENKFFSGGRKLNERFVQICIAICMLALNDEPLLKDLLAGSFLLRMRS